MGLPQAKRLLLMLAEEINLFYRLRRKEVVLMYITWDQLIAFSLLLVTIIAVCIANKDR